MQPVFRSLVFVDLPAPDYADMSIIALPPGAPIDPALWARTVFSARSMPLWVRAAFALRELMAPLIGVPRGSRDVFDVRAVHGEEALLSIDDRHLDFRVGVGVDPESRLVRVVTAVRLKGWRGRVYFWPVRLGHPLVVDAMLERARRRLAAA
ncbi:MAG: DUF2867 domain-containing protein [Microcella sp.]|uniref:DUF2867 domain-containing protein n=1 Tax=Microcella sp. TaxID=1913979 RepID=UPI0024C78BC0|nr:DUF2867 domain-containing protein [Microcella sp.]UYN83394.1 MAG: DUF2867 domain-containing protein [Microcella sp.]